MTRMHTLPGIRIDWNGHRSKAVACVRRAVAGNRLLMVLPVIPLLPELRAATIAVQVNPAPDGLDPEPIFPGISESQFRGIPVFAFCKVLIPNRQKAHSPHPPFATTNLLESSRPRLSGRVIDSTESP